MPKASVSLCPDSINIYIQFKKFYIKKLELQYFDKIDHGPAAKDRGTMEGKEDLQQLGTTSQRRQY